MVRQKIIFLATPEFALPAMNKVADCGSYKVAAVITQPDKPAGRGLKLTSPAAKLFAEQRGFTVFQPTSLKSLECTQQSYSNSNLQSTNPELAPLCEFLNAHDDALFIVIAYGKIIPNALMEFSSYPVLNIHPSLLPRWRGAAPIQHALFAGDAETGVTIMGIDSGLDTGPVFRVKKIPILPSDDLGTLHDRLAALGSELLIEVIEGVLTGDINPIPQQENGVTYAEKWDKQDSIINWYDPLAVTLRRIKTCSPFPGAKTTYLEKEIKIFAAHEAVNCSYPANTPGQIVEVNKAEVIVATANSGYISIDMMQFPGKNKLPIKDIIRGHQFKIGEKLI